MDRGSGRGGGRALVRRAGSNAQGGGRPAGAPLNTGDSRIGYWLLGPLRTRSQPEKYATVRKKTTDRAPTR